MKAAALVVAATALLGLYMVVRAVDLFRTGTVLGILLGIGVLLLVLVGGLLVTGEVRLGAGSARLAARLEAEGDLPDPELERTASGRLTEAAAERLFALRKGEVEAAPTDWRVWWRLAAAYGEARDTSAGRRAMRKAIALEKASRLS
ncbi:MAG: hypothetical protein LC789_15760 [Actinobacteria bacterium]|nr:hypothetical protein [Actinomycetota bacterium]MCA1720911.1 hypothetical protein [Actinomycetota bacterium]